METKVIVEVLAVAVYLESSKILEVGGLAVTRFLAQTVGEVELVRGGIVEVDVVISVYTIVAGRLLLYIRQRPFPREIGSPAG